MSGYIKLHRGWQESDIFPDEPYCRRAAWVWLIENAAWKDTKRRDSNGSLIEVKRGQIHTSMRTLGRQWKWSKNKVERFFRDLKTCEMVDHEAGHGGSIITLCNYEKYQGRWDTDGPRAMTPADHRRTTQEEGKERKEEKNIPRERGFSFPCPDEVSPDAWADFMKVRKAKKAPMTETALKGLRREADKAGLSLAVVVEECAGRGWQSFKAEWVGETQKSKSQKAFVDSWL